MPNLYIIAGCNGAGKTTASNTFLPDNLNCKEFVNADEIAKGLSPFQPESVAISAGKIMLNRIKELSSKKIDFAVETTLSSHYLINFIKQINSAGYISTLIFLYLDSHNLAYKRVMERVKNGGHGIDKEVLIRRYERGLKNFFLIYKEIVDSWLFIDNSTNSPILLAEGGKNLHTKYNNSKKYKQIMEMYNG
ncbi:MAG: zeta toxin family protein [bacterium]